MSVWQDQEDNPTTAAQSAMKDAVFKIECTHLPVDHARALTDTLCECVPWLAEHTGAGVHPIHVAGSQNGWQRPESNSGEPLILSKRTRLRIRVPTAQADSLINALTGTSHTIGGQSLTITAGRAATLTAATTLFSRYAVYTSMPTDENEFLQCVVNDCQAIGYQPVKLLCGKSNYLSTPTGRLEAKSILIADVPPEYSLPLQEQGLGDFRLMGCGLLIPHKD
ncbi:MAG: type I-MYXAN CRISPR-associated protein Cas6/Cmx6, partial [Pseudomonadota bacterium]